MHNHDIFHRDLKPENIFMDGETPKIADFGLARSYRMKAVSNSMEMKGTLAYMPPEQFSDFRKADQTADIYSLGKLLFEGFYGKLDQKILPFKSVSLTDPETPFLKEMDAIIQKATAEDKNHRFQAVSELRNRLTKALDLNKKIEKETLLKHPIAAEFIQTYSRWIWLGIVCAVLSVMGMIIWHLAGEPEYLKDLKQQITKSDTHDIGYSFPENRAELKDNLMGRDGSSMILTGDKTIHPNQQNIEKNLFYMDKTKISNYLFVDFLNEIKGDITVENGILKHNDIILLYLGTGSEPEDQILYEHERFHLKNQEEGSKAVTRISYHGASEYARFHGKELLTETEWKFAYRYHRDKYIKENPEKIEIQEPARFMMHGGPETKKEEPEIKVLDGMGVLVNEWVRIEENSNIDNTSSSIDIKTLSGVIDYKRTDSESKAVPRHQWEGFSDVGFRTKIRVGKR